MGVVYRARHSALDRTVALEVLRNSKWPICVTAIAASCANWSPSVGAAQAECSYDSPEGNPATEYGTYGTGSGMCALFNAGDDCDNCQAANCCALSRNCYYDPSCKSADEELDHCSDDASNATTPDAVPAGIAQCRAAFAASGVNAREVIACEATCCSARCVALPLTQ